MIDIEAVLAAVNRDLPDGFTFRISSENRPEPGWLAIEATTPMGTGHLAWVADAPLPGLRTAQGELIEQELGAAWPRCPIHGSHPLKPEEDGWHCPNDPSASPWPYGTLRDVPVAPEPERADGEVRWWFDDLGWGVVASDEGDLFVHFSAIEAEGYRSLREGERVEYRTSGGQYGAFRRAEWVRRVGG